MTIASKLNTLLADGISGNQAKLVDILSRQGVATTQSSVSRALKKINAVKGLDENGDVIYSLPKMDPERIKTPFFESLVYKIDHNGQLIVIHTRPGTANTVAKFIDDHDLDEVMGSVAGDDTIIIVPADAGRTTQVVKILQSYLNKIGVFL
ncbi:MAG: hypothetical protein L3J69_09820 [Desulfobacula sp.]|nr:hypothetical protein [Desulfobacula sp.]